MVLCISFLFYLSVFYVICYSMYFCCTISFVIVLRILCVFLGIFLCKIFFLRISCVFPCIFCRSEYFLCWFLYCFVRCIFSVVLRIFLCPYVSFCALCNSFCSRYFFFLLFPIYIFVCVVLGIFSVFLCILFDL
jgi:hypothetical protein